MHVWAEKASPIRWHLIRALKEMKGQAMCYVLKCCSRQKRKQGQSPEVRLFGAFLRNSKETSKAGVIGIQRLEMSSEK